MKQRSIFLVVLAFISCGILSAVNVSFTPGTQVWNIALKDISISNTVESKVCNFQVDRDFNSTFTVLDTILSKMCLVESKSEFFLTRLDKLEDNVTLDLSKACIIENNLSIIQLNLLSLDTNGTFTVLDSLKQIICSKIELLNVSLENVQTNIIGLTQEELDHAATIASQLEVLNGEVMSINSILDTLNFDLKLNTACSLLDVIDGCLQTVESKVGLLDGVIPTGFAGTFTALDFNLAKACTIESLVDLLSASFIIDLSEVFSALAELNEKICTIDSKVDDIDILTILSSVDLLDSKLDPLISKLSVLESEIDVLESKGDAAAGNPFFSLIDNAIQILDQDCSILEELNNNQMLEKSCTIESNLDVVTTELPIQQSKLEVIDQELQTITSKICTVKMGNIAISKLCLVDSKLDVELNSSLTIESIIDSFIVSEGNIDVLDDLGQTIFSKLCIVDTQVATICSKLDALRSEFQTVDSKLDVIIPNAQSNLDGVITIESRIDSIAEQLVTDALISKLCLIEDQVCTIASSLDIMGPLIGMLNMQAQELIDDFQETWTVLQVIENKLCNAEAIFGAVSDKLINPFEDDLSGVFTAIEAVEQKARTVDVKVNIYESLTDAIDDIDFSGVFTVLDAISMKVCTIASRVDVVDTAIDAIIDCLGTGITVEDIGTTGFTITQPGRYYLADSVMYDPTAANAAITISADNVFLDLNNKSIEQVDTLSGVDGIEILDNSTNITVANGTIRTPFRHGIFIGTGCIYITLKNIQIIDVQAQRGVFVQNNSRYIFMENVSVSNFNDSNNEGIFLDGTGANPITDVFIKDSVSLGNDNNGVYLNHCVRANLTNILSASNGQRGFFLQNTGVTEDAFFVIKNCKALENGTTQDGFRLENIDKSVMMNCVSQLNAQEGVFLQNVSETVFMFNNFSNNGRAGIRFAGGNSDTCYFAFNTMLVNAADNLFEAATNGPNTILGNFAFGAGSGENYDINGLSDLTNKTSVITQTTSLGDRPTEWTNIDMN